MILPKRIYELAFLAGLFAGIYLYAFHFDDFSETDLVRFSYLWVAAVIFGTHGLLASEWNDTATDEDDTSATLDAWQSKKGRSGLSKLATVLIWSVLGISTLVSWKRPWAVALAGTLVWLAGLAFFFEAIFPAL